MPPVINFGVQRLKFNMKDVAIPPDVALQRTSRLVRCFAYGNLAPTRQAAELGC